MIKKLLMILICIVLILIIAIAGFIAYTTFTEYMPATEERLQVTKAKVENDAETDSVEMPRAGYAFNIMTWSIGYGTFGDNADYFFDGGTMIQPSSEDRVNSNLANIVSQIKYHHPNIVMLQDVDKNSTRTYYLDEVQRIASNMGKKYSTFALNYSVPYIPYPWPPIGHVESGLLTLSDYAIDDALRIQLPLPYSWPLRLANPKRCLTVHRIPVEGSGGRELIIINLNLESYNDKEGRAAQIEMLKRVLENEDNSGNYVIAGGNFNQVFSSVDTSEFPILSGSWNCLKLDESVFGDSWQFLMDNSVPTCRYLNKPYAGANHDPESFQYYMLDGFIVSSNVKVLICETKDMGFTYSDHNPVFLRVKLLP